MRALPTQQPKQSPSLQSNNQEEAGQSYQICKVQTEYHNLQSELKKFYSDNQEVAGQSYQPFKVQTEQQNLQIELKKFYSERFEKLKLLFTSQEEAGQSYQPCKAQTEQHNLDSILKKFYSDNQEEAGQSQQLCKVQTEQNNLDSEIKNFYSERFEKLKLLFTSQKKTEQSLQSLQSGKVQTEQHNIDSESQILQSDNQVQSRLEQSQQQEQSTQFSEIQKNKWNQEKNESLNNLCNKFENQNENLHIFLRNLKDGDNFLTFSLYQESAELKQKLLLLIVINKDGKKYIKLQMSIIQEGNMLQQVSIQDYIMTLPNICLSRNKDLNLGSFFYSHQNSQIIYEANLSKMLQINQLVIIIEKVINNFKIIIKYILQFQFKIEGSYYSTYESKSDLSEILKKLSENFSKTEMNMNSEKTKENARLSTENQQEQEIDQYYVTIHQLNDNKPTSRKPKQLVNKSQIVTLQNLNYEQKVLEQIKNTENNLIDQGGFHKIYKIRLDIGTGIEQEYAVKTQQNEKLEKEIQFIKNYLQNSYSKYIVQAYVINSKKNLFYILEYCYFKSLRDYQKKYSLVISLNTKMRILRQITKGIFHLHERRIFHLDIKPDNILIDLEGNAKICDFGEAFHPNYQFQRDCIKYSIPYSAPELLKHKTKFISAKADVFSFGILASELCFGKLPTYFLKKDQYLKKYKNQEIEGEVENLKEGPRQIVSKLKTLIQKCTNYDIKARPGIQSVLQYLKILKKQHEVE